MNGHAGSHWVYAKPTQILKTDRSFGANKDCREQLGTGDVNLEPRDHTLP